MTSPASRPPYTPQYDPNPSRTPYLNSDAYYSSTTLDYNGRPSGQPAYSPSQPTPYPPNGDPYGRTSTAQNQQGPSFSYNGPYNASGISLRRERSPSPTPSDIEAMKRPLVDWKVVLNWRTYAKVKNIPLYLALIVISVLVILMSVFHKQIVNWLKPAADWMHSVPFGWVIPIVVLIVLSFPPLFGHEIVGVLCGVVWGLWIGFLIMCAGTLIGEILTYYVFKYFCRARAEKHEKSKATYACLARVVREGGFKICLMARLSAMPGHFTTAVFATCGMNIFVFTLAAVLSLPKQFVTVYVGVILEHSNDTPEEQQQAKTSQIISNVVLVITLLITIAAMWWILREMKKVRPTILRERRMAKKRAMALAAAGEAPLARESNPELDSILDHHPLKENVGAWGGGGGYGYSGMGRDLSGAPHGGRSREEWELSNSRFEPYNHPTQIRGSTEVSGNITPTYKQGGSSSSQGEIWQHQPTDNNGTNPFLQSNSYQTPTQQTYPVQSSTTQQPVDRSLSPPSVVINAPSTGLYAGVSLTDPGPARPDLSVNSGHVSKRSVEVHSGHGIGRSFRASVEGGNAYS